MALDTRTRLFHNIRRLEFEEITDRVIPDAVTSHGELAARGIDYQHLPSLGFVVDGAELTLRSNNRTIVVDAGIGRADVVAELLPDAFSDLVQDVQSTMGLAMTSRVKISNGAINDWIGWEPALRALLDGRKVHEIGDVTFVDLDGDPLDLDRTFTIDDDLEEMAHFLRQAGFLHLRDFFDADEMADVGRDIDEWIARATPDDGESWWATDDHGVSQAVRVLFFYEKSGALRALVDSDRYRQIAELVGEGHVHRGGGEGLVKPLGIVRGLSDLPWHKDCGQGQHSYNCSGLTCGISVTGADANSGALGVVPGSHRANTMATGRDPRLDLASRKLETRTGDVTVHCSDTLHRAYPPIERPRKVVYSGFGLPPKAGDVVAADPRYSRAARAELSSVQDRIEAADNEQDPRRYQARRGH